MLEQRRLDLRGRGRGRGRGARGLGVAGEFLVAVIEQRDDRAEEHDHRDGEEAAIALAENVQPREDEKRGESEEARGHGEHGLLPGKINRGHEQADPGDQREDPPSEVAPAEAVLAQRWHLDVARLEFFLALRERVERIDDPRHVGARGGRRQGGFWVIHGPGSWHNFAE